MKSNSTPNTTLFISDLHLEDRRPVTTRLFLEFLQGPAAQARALYILGDLFEAWIGDDAPGRVGRQVARALSELSATGVDIYFMHGNRDFLVGDAYCRRAGITLLSQPLVVDLHGRRVLISHGDELCTDDVDYQRFRRKVRDQAWQHKMLRRPVWLRKLYAWLARATSRHRTAAKPLDIMDVNPQAVTEAIRRHGVSCMIHGHTHRPAIHELAIDGKSCQRIVLGDWYTQGSVLEITDEDMQLHVLGRAPSQARAGRSPPF